MTDPINVAVSGCRTVPWDATFSLAESLPENIALILVGDCPTGVDLYVREYCKRNHQDHAVYEADWDKHGRAAGPIRNREMVSTADLLIAFWDGKSRGTLSAITEAARIGIPVRIFPVKS